MITRRRESGQKKITKGRVSGNFLKGVEFYKLTKKKKKERKERKKCDESELSHHRDN